MNRRLFLLVLMLLSSAGPAFADQGKDDSGGDDNSGHGGGGDGGDDNSGDGGGGDGEDDSGGDGGGDDDGGDGEAEGGGDNPSGSHDSQRANRAVTEGEALPLKKMLAIFATYGDYTVIDVKLVRRDGTLLYQFKFIDTAGQVRKAYFDALDGTLAS